MSSHSICPCGRDDYASCCGPLHEGEGASTAERLMRSRYSAFVLGLGEYLLETWHPDTRPDGVEFDDEIVWKRLLIEATERGGPFDSEGTVIFTAIGRTPEGRFEQHECSRFVRLGTPSRWVYLDGDLGA